ncbi:hypothetical protein D4764_01G0007660 [Takifugu flavidus]|uniref:Uncharacterized protein n=1 Tax=Takifugu flavidus TaxID=433684 RepID=A0A5C6PQ73_9TELE|nr:hypothetical protein D4764_01G0007660 [Takifugu flavidus]
MDASLNGLYQCEASNEYGSKYGRLYVHNNAGDHRTTDENNQLAREQEEESLRGEAQFNLRSIGLQNRTAV